MWPMKFIPTINIKTNTLLTAGIGYLSLLANRQTLKLLVLLLSTLAFMFSSPALADQLTEQQINQLIAETIKVRRSNKELFNTNLARLNSFSTGEHQLQLSTAQQEDILYLQAYQLTLNGDNSQAISKHQLLEHSANINNRLRSYLAQLNLYLLADDFSRSNLLVDNILSVVDEVDDIIMINDSFEMIGYYYYDLGKYQLALNYFSLKNINSSDAANLCVHHNLVALSQLASNQIKANDIEIVTVIKDCRATNDHIVANSTVIENANQLIVNGEYQLAIKHLLENKEFLLNVDYYAHNISMHSLLAKANFELERYSAATTHANSALALIKKFPATKHGQLAFEVLSALQILQQNYQQALSYLQTYQNIEASNADLKRRKDMAGAQAKHQAQQYSRRLQQLRNENQRSITTFDDLDNANKKIVRQLDLNLQIIALLLVVYCLLYGLIFALKAKKQGLKNQANIDAFTGLYGRKHFIDLLAGMIYQDKFANQNLTLITLNLDDFKQINQQFGMAYGDYILTKVVNIFTKLAIKNAVMARTSSDEFCIALGNTELQSGLVFAERFLTEIGNLATTDDKIMKPLTASFGVTNTSLCNYVPKSLFSDANKAMLKAKQQGKNQVASFEQHMSKRTQYQMPTKLKYIFKK